MQKWFALKIVIDVEKLFSQLLNQLSVEFQVQFPSRSREIFQSTRTFRTAQIASGRWFDTHCKWFSPNDAALQNARNAVRKTQQYQIRQTCKRKVTQNLKIVFESRHELG